MLKHLWVTLVFLVMIGCAAPWNPSLSNEGNGKIPSESTKLYNTLASGSVPFSPSTLNAQLDLGSGCAGDIYTLQIDLAEGSGSQRNLLIVLQGNLPTQGESFNLNQHPTYSSSVGYDPATGQTTYSGGGPELDSVVEMQGQAMEAQVILAPMSCTSTQGCSTPDPQINSAVLTLSHAPTSGTDSFTLNYQIAIAGEGELQGELSGTATLANLNCNATSTAPAQ